MTNEKYNEIIMDTVQKCLETLTSKKEEYAKGSIFHNFEKAAALHGETKEMALRGMMSKHIISIYDMIPEAGNYTPEQWQEKIGDAINYLLILSAMVQEEGDV